jgi:hypothetical protein
LSCALFPSCVGSEEAAGVWVRLLVCRQWSFFH